MFTKVDRASRCTEDFARLLRLSEEQGWRLIVTEMGIDTRTPMGKVPLPYLQPWRQLPCTCSRDCHSRLSRRARRPEATS